VVVIVLLDTHQDAVTDESANSTLVSIIRRTAIGERPLIFILIAVNFLPASVRIGIQRITYLDYGL
jgi:hypothetical protein